MASRHSLKSSVCNWPSTRTGSISLKHAVLKLPLLAAVLLLGACRTHRAPEKVVGCSADQLETLSRAVAFARSKAQSCLIDQKLNPHVGYAMIEQFGGFEPLYDCVQGTARVTGQTFDRDGTLYVHLAIPSKYDQWGSTTAIGWSAFHETLHAADIRQILSLAPDRIIHNLAEQFPDAVTGCELSCGAPARDWAGTAAWMELYEKIARRAIPELENWPCPDPEFCVMTRKLAWLCRNPGHLSVEAATRKYDLEAAACAARYLSEELPEHEYARLTGRVFELLRASKKDESLLGSLKKADALRRCGIEL